MEKAVKSGHKSTAIQFISPAVVTLSSILRFAGIGGRFSLGHPMTWLVITLVCLFVGYTWLSAYTTHASVVVENGNVRKITDFDDSIDPGELLTDDGAVVEKEPEMTITQNDDQSRAEEYLAYEALQQRILPLLDSADVNFENGRYVTPPGNNAWENYNAILALSPGESIAISGKNKVKSTLLAGAEQAIDTGDIAGAEGWLVQLDVIQPDNDAQIELREEILELVALETERKLKQQEAEALQRKIDTTLEQAASEADKPEGNFNKVRDLYERVLELDPGNEGANAGLVSLADSKLDEAEQALRDGDLELAEKDLQLAAVLDDKNKRIGSLELALGVSIEQQNQAREQEELLAKQAEAEAKQAAEAEAEAANQSSPEPVTVEITPGTTPEQPDADQSASTATPSVGDTQPEPEPLAVGIIAQARQNQKSANPDSKSERSRKAMNDGIAAYYRGDYNRSFELLYPLAQDGVTRAQFRIGIMYQFGRSVAKNSDLAEKWFTTALPALLRLAQEGVAWARTDLGTAYEFGISLQQDYDRAAYWYQLAADQGYPGAQTNLGVLYAQGDGVPYNRSQAIYWFRKAARQGDRVARENLGILGATP